MTAAALITGTAGEIGAATAAAFARAGFAVAGVDRRPSGLPPSAVCVTGDAGTPATLEEALAAIAELGTLAHAVGVAGGSLDGEVAAEAQGRLPTLEEFRASVDANLTLAYALVAATVPLLRSAGAAGLSPSVTLVSSINALASYGLPAYSAAKAGLAGLAVALADTLGRHGIRINVLALGTVPNAHLRALYPDTDFAALGGRAAALRRLATPEQVADSVLAIATAMTHTTGQVLVADGGQLVRRG
jgi:3-oxoacyl-[acyl-carrier protein] reductase